MRAARTAVEIAKDGTPIRVFHRRGSSAWTHPIDDPTFKTHGRHDALVTRPCPVCVKSDKQARGRTSEPSRAALVAPGVTA